MVLLGYYRRYILIYLYLLLGLFLFSIAGDTISYMQDESEDAQKDIFAKTITSLFVFVFSYLSICINHFALEKTMKTNELKMNKIVGLNEFIKKKKKFKSSINKKTILFAIHLLVVLLILMPLLIGESVKFFTYETQQGKYFHNTGIAIAGALLKSVSGFLTLIIGETSLFFSKKRKLQLD